MHNSKERQYLKHAAREARHQSVRVLYAVRNGFLYRSTDGGVNWKLRADAVLAGLVAEGTTLVAGRH